VGTPTREIDVGMEFPCGTYLENEGK